VLFLTKCGDKSIFLPTNYGQNELIKSTSAEPIPELLLPVRLPVRGRQPRLVDGVRRPVHEAQANEEGHR
jgi:hypothetical protein